MRQVQREEEIAINSRLIKALFYLQYIKIMSSFESFEENEKTKEIKRLIESGEACDVEDAKDALFEKSEAEFFRGLNKEEFLEQISERLKELDSESEKSEEPLERDNERYNLRFEKAAVFGADNADEREFLYYKYWLDLPVAESEDDAVNKRRESSRRRLKEKADALSLKIGKDRSEKIFEKYRAELQELFESY